MWQEFAPLLAAMLVLAAGSAFFSCSEAALFSLRSDDRRRLKKGNPLQRAAVELLAEPDRLLTAILFWNLIINIVYFALASVVSIQLQDEHRHTDAGIFALVSLLAIILLSEMAPKTVGVLLPRRLASVVSLPLAVAVRLLDPIAPLLGVTTRVIRRVFFPHFKPEPYLEVSDLEQAISRSTADEALAAQERIALANIVRLSDLHAEELMRPRRQYQSFRPPVSLEDLGGRLTRSGYLLVTEPDSDEIEGAIALAHLPTVPRQHLENFAEQVVYVPWSATVAAVFDELQKQQLEVAVVINEFGETIGVVTLEDLLETIFEDQSSRSTRLLATTSVEPLGDNRWRVTGMTSLRRLAKKLEVEFPPSRSMTVAGILQEQLQRLPVKGDTVRWHEMEFRVVEAEMPDKLIVELTRIPPEEPSS